MKRLRKAFPQKIRFFQCGEYGEEKGRPHYHSILFNIDFPDKIREGSSNGHPLYTSETLTQIWGKGRAIIGDVTFESAAYVARYIMKKVTGELADDHYEKINETTGEITKLTPEFITMSRMPGIATKWFEKYHSNVYPHDFVVVDGKKHMPPKFYDTLFERMDAKALHKIKVHRADRTPEQILESDSFRLLAKEMVAEAQFKKLIRNIH